MSLSRGLSREVIYLLVWVDGLCFWEWFCVGVLWGGMDVRDWVFGGFVLVIALDSRESSASVRLNWGWESKLVIYIVGKRWDV